MKDVSVLDIFYTGSLLFLVFYGAIALTKFFAKEEDEGDKDEPKEK